jgi:hypothetical protein
VHESDPLAPDVIQVRALHDCFESRVLTHRVEVRIGRRQVETEVVLVWLITAVALSAGTAEATCFTSAKDRLLPPFSTAMEPR